MTEIFAECYIEKMDPEFEYEVFEALKNESACKGVSLEPKADGHKCVMTGFTSEAQKQRIIGKMAKRFGKEVSFR